MKSSILILACIMLSALASLSACESVTAPYAFEDRIIHFYTSEELSVDQHLDRLRKTYDITDEDINFIYENAFRGVSVRLHQVQVQKIFYGERELRGMNPAKYRVYFRTPSAYSGWTYMQRYGWTLEKIDEIQIKYSIPDNRVFARFSASQPVVTVRLSDVQLAGMDVDERIDYIHPFIWFRSFKY